MTRTIIDVKVISDCFVVGVFSQVIEAVADKRHLASFAPPPAGG
jgi:hypothetical protein